jgi:hypothetical protein
MVHPIHRGAVHTQSLPAFGDERCPEPIDYGLIDASIEIEAAVP